MRAREKTKYCDMDKDDQNFDEEREDKDGGNFVGTTNGCCKVTSSSLKSLHGCTRKKKPKSEFRTAVGSLRKRKKPSKRRAIKKESCVKRRKNCFLSDRGGSRSTKNIGRSKTYIRACERLQKAHLGDNESIAQATVVRIDVPLMWAVAAADDQCAVMQWLMAKSEYLRRGNVLCRGRQNQLGSVSERHAQLEHLLKRGSVRVDPQPGIPTSQVGSTFQRQGARTHSEFCDCQGPSRSSTRVVVRAHRDEFVPRSPDSTARSTQSSSASEWEVLDRIFGRSFPDASLSAPRMPCAVEREI